MTEFIRPTITKQFNKEHNSHPEVNTQINTPGNETSRRNSSHILKHRQPISCLVHNEGHDLEFQLRRDPVQIDKYSTLQETEQGYSGGRTLASQSTLLAHGFNYKITSIQHTLQDIDRRLNMKRVLTVNLQSTETAKCGKPAEEVSQLGGPEHQTVGESRQ